MFTITPFTAGVSCGTSSAVFSYSGLDQTGAALPSFISVNSATGDITMTVSASPTNYYITITGTITLSGQSISANIQILVNSPRTFVSAPLY